MHKKVEWICNVPSEVAQEITNLLKKNYPSHFTPKRGEKELDLVVNNIGNVASIANCGSLPAATLSNMQAFVAGALSVLQQEEA